MPRASRSVAAPLLALLGAGVVLCRSFIAFSTPAGTAPQRRELLLAPASAALLATLGASDALAVDACNKDANNCFSSASAAGKTKISPWKFPADKTAAVADLKAVLAAYPQEGQDGVDQGGWSYAVDELADKGYARLEFKSGIGNFARFFNGGQPFIDDLEFSVGDQQVDVRSSSRVGDSDLGVNAKRLNYLSKALRSKGWEAAEVKA